MRKMALICLLASTLLLNACSSGNSDAPSDRNAHPTGWLLDHALEVLDTADYVDCGSCHGVDLQGSGNAVSCYLCHVFNTTPPFIIHPESWVDAYSSHRAYAALNGSDECLGCHGPGLRGSIAAPSCFSDSVDGLGCHAEGPGAVPHPLGSFQDGSYVPGPYVAGSEHGPDARQDLTVCQNCHGEAGGPGDNPRFNVGIFGSGCESCHGLNYAHPDPWSRHRLAGSIQDACTLCHGMDLDGNNAVGVSCLECHTVNPGLNPSGCVSCHNVPPDAEPPAGAQSPNLSGEHNRVGHAAAISAVPMETCDRCHSGAGTGTDLHFDMSRPADVNLPLLPQDTIVPVSTGTNTTCNGSCHFEGFDVPHDNETWYGN